MALLAGHAATIREAEVEAVLEKLAHLSPRDREIVAGLGRAVSQKLMHAPLFHLRKGGAGDAAALRRAFGLAEPSAAPGQFPWGRSQSPTGSGQSSTGSGQFPTGSPQSPTEPGQFPAEPGQFSAGSPQFPAGSGQFQTGQAEDASGAEEAI